MCIVFGADGVIGDVTMTPNCVKLQTAITPLIFKLERRVKAQKVANTHGYLFGMSKSGRHFS